MFFTKKAAPAAPRDPIAEFDRAISKAVDAALADVDRSNFAWNAPRWARIANLIDRLDDRRTGLRRQMCYRPAV
jgi:hypothetical protein